MEPLLRTREGRGDPPINWYPDPALSGYQRAIVFEPGFGLDPDESRNPATSRYGRASMAMRWLLRGPKGAVQFLMSTGWTPEPEPPNPRWPSVRDWMHTAPSGFDLGYHAYVPQYEGAEQYGEQPCQYLGAPCWYDGSGLRAEPVLTAFFDQGEDGVWEALRAEHDALIGPEDQR